MQLKEIYSGFKNLIFQDEKIEAKAEKKLKTCFSCPHRVEVKCGKCGCWLAAKARSEYSECPDGRW